MLIVFLATTISNSLLWGGMTSEPITPLQAPQYGTAHAPDHTDLPMTRGLLTRFSVSTNVGIHRVALWYVLYHWKGPLP